MRTIYDAAERVDGRKLAATVGFFDGVHAGHRSLIAQLREAAAERGLASAVFTFPVHPRRVLQADYRPQLLDTFEEKLARIGETGVDYCAVLDFTPALARLTAREFIERLAAEWGVSTLVVGYDHRFGRDRAEGFEAYVAHGRTVGMEVVRGVPYLLEDGTAVSSSRIRALLTECRVEEAARMLTVPYRLRGHVVGGQQIGRTMGFPTANLSVDEPLKVLPGDGVYTVRAWLRGMAYRGMLSIGNRPTIGDRPTAVEVHLLGFSGDVYGETIEVEFIRHLRNNRRFDSLDALREQLERDRETVAGLPIDGVGEAERC
mgnify:FL=1